MSEDRSHDELHTALAAADPMPEQLVAGHLPPSVNELVICDIIDWRPAGRPGRLRSSLAPPGFIADPLGAPLALRLGFLAALVVVASALVAVNVVADEPAGEQVTVAPASDVTTSTLDGRSGPAPGGEIDTGPAGATGSTEPPAPLEEEGPDRSNDGTGVDEAAPGSTAMGPGVDASTVAGTSADPPEGACFTVEAESLASVAGWDRSADPAASGGEYLVWTGPPAGPGSPDPASILEVPLEVAVPGTYRFSWSTQAPATAGTGDEPAARLAVIGAARFGPAGGGRYAGFVDIIGGGLGGFGWAATASVDGAHSDPTIELDQAGTYLLQLAPGAVGHRIDRIVVHHQSIDLAEVIADRCP
jgi:hypothetical protein